MNSHFINDIKGASENMVLDFIKEETIKINTNNKICEMLLTKPQNIFDNTYDKENIISTTSLSFAINGNAQVISLNKLLKHRLFGENKNLKVNFVGAVKKNIIMASQRDNEQLKYSLNS